ncbi:MAG: NUDIX domain-containing protein [bacterium]
MSNVPKQCPEPVVGAVIFNPQGKILIIRSAKWGNKYIIPGGHIKPGEKMEAALQREIREETGLPIYDIKLISVKENIPSEKYHKNRHFIFIDYVCKANSSAVVLNEEAQEYKWIDLRNIEKFDLCGFTKKLLLEIRDKDKRENKVSIFYN